MSPPRRPKGECRRAERVGTPASRLLPLALAAIVAPVNAAPAFDGQWLVCLPRRSPGPYALVQVQGDTYKAEWGCCHTSSGRAAATKHRVVLRGCQAISGEAAPNCDPARPPIWQVLHAGQIAGNAAARAGALARGMPVKVGAEGVAALAEQCQALHDAGRR